jgi:hypothetical protein
MGYFILNTSTLADGINKYKNSKRKYKDDINSTYNMLKNVDGGWYSPQATVLVEKLKKDKYEIDNYLNKIESMYQELEFLKNSFDNLFASFGCKRGSKLRYDDEYYWQVMRNLDNATGYLNNALSYVNSCNFHADFKAIHQVYVLRTEIVNLKTMITSIKNSLTVFKNKTNKIFADTREGLKPQKNTKLNVEKLNYNWSAVDIEDSINI